MPITGVNNMITTSDNRLPNPVKYPGLYSRKKKNGTLKSKSEWLVEEAKFFL